MQAYQQNFLDFVIRQQVLRFGEFTLKSGRKSPYFFNTGLLHHGKSIAALGHFYAQTIVDHQLEFDGLFGPAYKGIPLAVTTAMALATDFERNIPFSFNRKERKEHGEGGQLIGASLKGKVLLIDDVITAGTAIREAMNLITAAGAELAGVVIALNRQEKGQTGQSTVTEIEQTYHTQVISIITVTELVRYLENTPEYQQFLPAMRDYQTQYAAQ